MSSGNHSRSCTTSSTAGMHSRQKKLAQCSSYNFSSRHATPPANLLLKYSVICCESCAWLPCTLKSSAAAQTKSHAPDAPPCLSALPLPDCATANDIQCLAIMATPNGTARHESASAVRTECLPDHTLIATTRLPHNAHPCI